MVQINPSAEEVSRGRYVATMGILIFVSLLVLFIAIGRSPPSALIDSIGLALGGMIGGYFIHKRKTD